jgi:MHS family proline/betaine transporter-like MFS transporter
VTYLVETAPQGRRGFAGSWANIGSLGGMLLGSAAAAAATGLLDAAALQSWGWRVPFLFGAALGLGSLALRRNLPKSPHFARYHAARCPTSPLREAFTCNRREMAQGTLFASAYGSVFYLALVYLPTWAGETGAAPPDEAMRLNTLALALMIPAIPLAGWLSDRWLRRTRLLAWAFGLLGAAGTLLLVWMQRGGAGSFAAAQIALALILAAPLGAAPALFTELFPEPDRLTGYSIVFNTGLGLFGGATPMAASWLILRTGSDLAPAGMLLMAALLGLGALLWMRDRSREPLRTTCGTSIRSEMEAPRAEPEGRWSGLPAELRR